MGIRSISPPDRPTPSRPAEGPTFVRRAGQPSTEPEGAGRDLYTTVLTDVVGSARAVGAGQRRMREDLYHLVQGTVRRRGFGLSSFALDDTGDGLRLLVPCNRLQPGDVVDMFVLGLQAELRQYRRYTAEDARIRLRVAFDLGLVEPHLQGWAGDPLVRVARLIESEPLRAEFRSGVDLAVVVSDLLYTSVLEPGEGYVAPDRFRPVQVKVKEFDARAWLFTPQATGSCASCDRSVA